MGKLFTEDERMDWIKFCEQVAEEFEIDPPNFYDMTDDQLNKEADWYFGLTLK